MWCRSGLFTQTKPKSSYKTVRVARSMGKETPTVLRPLLRTPREGIHIIHEEWEFIQVPKGQE